MNAHETQDLAERIEAEANIARWSQRARLLAIAADVRAVVLSAEPTNTIRARMEALADRYESAKMSASGRVYAHVADDIRQQLIEGAGQ